MPARRPNGTLERLKAAALIPPQPAAKHHAAVAARERMRTAIGRDAAVDRRAHAEGAISELKRHGAARARCRGTRLRQLQLLAAATAINLKRLRPAQSDTSDEQTSITSARATQIAKLTNLFVDVLTEINRLTIESSTGS